MKPEAIYEAWAPPDGAWSLWVRPVLFAQMSESADASRTEAWQSLDVTWAPAAGECVVVIDLPGEESVLLGLALAGRGYRPVPVYNTCTGPSEVVDQHPLLRGLRAGGASLAAQGLALPAPPAFLLDSRRMSLPREVRPEDFDNRWKVLPRDLPSGQLLHGRGFTRILLVQHGQRQPHEDLALILRRWRDAGLALLTKDMAVPGPPRPLALGRPAWYRAIWGRLLELLGLRRGARGSTQSALADARG
jgi:hypothetical protein